VSVFKYGSFAHTAGTVDLVNFAHQRVRDPRLQAVVIKKVMTIEGDLIGTESQLNTSIANMESAYGTDGQDAILYNDDGSTASAHKLISADAVGGTRVTELTYPQGGAGQYATARRFRIVIEADFEAGGDDLVVWKESVEITGTGGPGRAVLQTITGSVQVQQIAAQTIVTARQSGQAVGYIGYPSFPGPIFAHEDVDRRAIARTGPDVVSDQFRNFGIRWSYSFRSPVPLSFGNPTAQ